MTAREPQSRKRAAEFRGRAAERYAAIFLVAKGYRVLTRRYRSARGEIDLIAKRGSNLVFVEVKARRREEDAIVAVTPRARRRIEDAAHDFLTRHPQFGSFGMRFDIMAVIGWRLRHIRDAWREND